MKKFLCTASLLLAFSMPSFANTNETKVVSTLEAETVITSKTLLSETLVDCITTVVKWITVDASETPTGPEITITVYTASVTVCDDGTMTIIPIRNK
jgi:hypothetical protein